MGSKSSELIARGVCVKDGMILLCRNVKRRHVFLPGGHVEFGESAAYALEREVMEEMGLRARAGRFLAAVQSRFMQGGVDVFELNLVFEVEIDGLSTAAAPRSMEGKIEFLWYPAADVAESGLRPEAMAQHIQGWLEDKAFSGRFIPPGAH